MALAPSWLAGKKNKSVPEVFGHRKLNHFLLSRVKKIVYFVDYVLIFSLDDSKENTFYPQKKKTLKFDVMLCSNASWSI